MEKNKEHDIKEIKEELGEIEDDLRLYYLEQKLEELEESIEKIKVNIKDLDPKAVIKNLFISKGNEKVIKNSLEEILRIAENVDTEDVFYPITKGPDQNSSYKSKMKLEKRKASYWRFNSRLWIDLSGLEKDDIKTRIEGKMLYIEGENSFASYSEKIEMPEQLNETEIKDFRNGILTIYFE